MVGYQFVLFRFKFGFSTVEFNVVFVKDLVMLRELAIMVFQGLNFSFQLDVLCGDDLNIFQLFWMIGEGLGDLRGMST